MTTKQINELIKSKRYPTDKEIAAMTPAQKKKVTYYTGYTLKTTKEIKKIESAFGW